MSLADPRGGLRFVTASDERIIHVEEQRTAFGEGPARARSPVVIGSDELDIAQVLADMATGYIVNARTLNEAERTPRRRPRRRRGHPAALNLGYPAVYGTYTADGALAVARCPG